MKTNFKYVMLMAAALVMGFSSCGNEEETAGGQDNGTPKSLFLKISNGPATYAKGGVVADATTVTFTSGDLYFTDASGVIKKHYTITSGVTSATNINMATLTNAGETITNLPGDVTAVYVVGNTSGLPTAGNISAVKSQALQVTSQGTITNVNLYGEVTTLTSTGTNTYSCIVNLAPTVARIELTDIKAGGVITGFKVAGIFVDNYYSQAAVNGTVVVGNLKDNGAVATAFNDNSTQYPTSLKTFVYDWYASGLAASGSPLVAKPATAGDVWGYNLFATAAGSTVPRIIIRLTDITATSASGITYTDDQFITIKGLKNGSTLTTIEAGKVYNIGAGLFAFDETNLTPTPNLSTIDVEVKVTLATWSVVDVTPEL